MDLQFVGMDPNTQGNGSPTVWVDADNQEIVVQGWKAQALMAAAIAETEWVPGHVTGVPEHETVVRVPLRMVPILREACDVAERRAGIR
ncbi:hypothetical protein MHW47_03735 [Streptomyces sp. OfavH-34-F]|uniref:hypothetical protein n=1 Tax=Streptomyces sp. OfavH-34-F TaxID=2917760 RepID=UPI001EF3726F|nr:hypothetical protein [Streptomyces sp. OfavH-34-F]MCG7523558.1 hypothetical protein [Streptomyces sp. OfavH-34-F]